MKKFWQRAEMDAPANVLWELLTDTDMWSEWGPSVGDVELNDSVLKLGSTGKVSTVVGVNLPFEITEFAEGSHWAWKVAGVPATSHTVDSLGSDRCRVGFGVPWLAAPYLAVCEIALRRLDDLATGYEVAR